MKVKLETVLKSEAALSELIQTPLPARTAYQLAKISRQVKQEIADFSIARKSAAERLGLGEVNLAQLSEAEAAKHVKEIKELGEELEEMTQKEVNITGVKLQFKYIEKLDIKPAILLDLDWLISAPASPRAKKKK